MGRLPLHAIVLRFAGTSALLTGVCAAYLVPTVLMSDRRPPTTVTAPPASDHAWTSALASTFPRCTDQVSWTRQHPVTGQEDRPTSVPSGLVVVDRHGRPSRMPFDDVVARAQNAPSADDVWVVGWCS